MESIRASDKKMIIICIPSLIRGNFFLPRISEGTRILDDINQYFYLIVQ